MSGRYFLGVFILLLGVGLLLYQIDPLGFGSIIGTYWPLLLVGIGVYQLLNRAVALVPGIIFTLLGIYFQLVKLEEAYDYNLLPEDIGKYIWPIILIIVGLTIIYRKTIKKEVEIQQDSVNNFVIFSGLEGRNLSKNFKGGSIVVMFGGAEIDLKDATLAEEGALLDLTVAFGGIDIKVPEDWRVIVSGIPVFGGWSNKARAPQPDNEDTPVLKVRCLVMFGGVDIKN